MRKNIIEKKKGEGKARKLKPVPYFTFPSLDVLTINFILYNYFPLYVIVLSRG